MTRYAGLRWKNDSLWITFREAPVQMGDNSYRKASFNPVSRGQQVGDKTYIRR